MNKDVACNVGVASDSIIPLWLKIMIGLVSISAVSMLIKYLATFGVSTSKSQEVWGQFGDFFGGMLNPLLSSLTLAAVLVTMRLQSKELKVAQQENKRANEHLEKQANYIRTQNFESVFFRLLDVHMNSRASVYFGGSSGREAFAYMESNSRNILAQLDLHAQLTGYDEQPLTYFESSFKALIGDALSVYCRGMYQVIKYVDTYQGFSVSEEVPVDERAEGLTLREKMQLRREQDKAYRPVYFSKRQYVNMLRAQLTPAELSMLYLSCLTKEGKGLKFLAEKYSLFKGLNSSSLKPGFANTFYSYLAFADYEDIQIRDVRMMDALNERMSLNKKRIKKLKTATA